MTMAYRPTWDDALTHADAERIRHNNLTWAEQWLSESIAEFEAAHSATLAALLADEAEAYETHAARRGGAAHAVVTAARVVLNERRIA